jgi:hypothetical protein
MDLGAAASGKGAKKDEVILAVPTEEKDINALYADELKLLAEPIPVIKATRSATQKQEDYYKVSIGPVSFFHARTLLRFLTFTIDIQD